MGDVLLFFLYSIKYEPRHKLNILRYHSLYIYIIYAKNYVWKFQELFKNCKRDVQVQIS